MDDSVSFSSDTSGISFGFDRFLHQFGILNNGYQGSIEEINNERLYNEDEAEMIDEEAVNEIEENYIHCNGNEDLTSLSS